MTTLQGKPSAVRRGEPKIVRKVANNRTRAKISLALGLLALAACVSCPVAAIGPAQLGVLVNLADPHSVAVGQRYLDQRGIPSANRVEVNFKSGTAVLSPGVFEAIKRRIDDLTPAGVQAFAITWTRPYRVGCMSVTTAVAAGYDPAFCHPPDRRCAPTRKLMYFDSQSSAPWTTHGIRPAMVLAGNTLAEVDRLIHRGVQSDGRMPEGVAYLLSTSDSARNVRAVQYGQVFSRVAGRIRVRRIEQDWIRDKSNVLFYFTGTTQVQHLETLRFVPGAVADHLTSAGGKLDGTQQMPVLAWLEAGATGSYGAVTEPCNYPDKFPRPAVLMDHYLNGETLIEAYWKSVASPGQGLFVGEPLARPFGLAPRSNEGDRM